MSTKRLSKEDWDKLDDLLSKHGFGGYYDLVECLKMAAEKVKRLTDPGFCADKAKDLPIVVALLTEAAEAAYGDKYGKDDREPDPCPVCGEIIPEDRETCPNCGYHDMEEIT